MSPTHAEILGEISGVGVGLTNGVGLTLGLELGLATGLGVGTKVGLGLTKIPPRVFGIAISIYAPAIGFSKSEPGRSQLELPALKLASTA